MIDTLMKQLRKLKKPVIWDKLNLQAGSFFVLTLHRPTNVGAERKLVGILDAISEAAKGLPVVFPVHPRTAKGLKELNKPFPGLCFIEPQGYLEFIYLVKHACGVITDSGGITEETTVLGIPCLTVRDNTERPETISVGTNELVGANPHKLVLLMAHLLNGKWKKGGIPKKWDGRAAERIVAVLERLLN